jgi:hypothetical protein
MPPLLQRTATPLIVGLFLVSLVSGTALFFHVGQGTFREMHEWLSLVLVVPFVLHLWKNWKPMANYFRKPALGIALALSLAMALPFALQSASGSSDGPPQFALSHTLLDNSAAELAPLLNATPEAVMNTLQAAGFTATGPDQPLTAIASQSGKSEFELAAALNGVSH